MTRPMDLMGSLPIRERATIAGNIVNASPIGDMTIMLMALDAELARVGHLPQHGELREQFGEFRQQFREQALGGSTS